MDEPHENDSYLQSQGAFHSEMMSAKFTSLLSLSCPLIKPHRHLKLIKSGKKSVKVSARLSGALVYFF